MAFTVKATKYWWLLLMPLFILLVIVLAPFAMLFSIFRLPFAKRHIIKLNKIIATDWLSRKKYVYIGYSDQLPLTDSIEHDVISKYGSHIIFDKWSNKDNKWTESEPDTYQRVATIWQDIAGDFDGDPLAIVGVLMPEQTEMTKTTVKVYYCNDDKNDYVTLDKEKILIKDARERILSDIETGLRKWSDKAN